MKLTLRHHRLFCSLTLPFVVLLTLLSIPQAKAKASGLPSGPEALSHYASQSLSRFIEASPKLSPQQALIVWQSHLGPTTAGRTIQGQAIEAALLVRNGMVLTGLEQLLNLKNPRSIDPRVIEWVRSAIGPENSAWSAAEVVWTTSWQHLFPNVPQIKSTTAVSTPIPPRHFKSHEKAIAKAAKDSPVQAQMRWRLALSAILVGDSRVASEQLDQLLNSQQTWIPRDQIYLAGGRLFYQERRFVEALNAYGAIPKQSDYWFQAAEEIAWTYAQMGNPDQALSKLKTLLVPVLAPTVGPEPFFVASFLNQRSCNYAQVFKTHRLFKTPYDQRIQNLTALQNSQPTATSSSAIAKWQKNPTIWRGTKEEMLSLPINFHRQADIRKAGIRRQIFTSELILAGQLDATLKQNGLAIGLGPSMNQIERGIQQTDQVVARSLQTLARRELQEIQRIVTRMHIIEADSIQRMQLLDQKVGPAKNRSHLVKNDGRNLIFPESSEIWLDEWDHFKVDATRCPNEIKESTL
jgi:tetratricopeptide (TPR) repeat protein